MTIDGFHERLSTDDSNRVIFETETGPDIGGVEFRRDVVTDDDLDRNLGQLHEVRHWNGGTQWRVGGLDGNTISSRDGWRHLSLREQKMTGFKCHYAFDVFGFYCSPPAAN